MKRLFAVMLAALIPCFAVAQGADSYPSRPVTLITPWTAGGVIDVIARAVSQSLEKQTGAAFLVENVPGAGSMIGTTRAANAKPDGYTLLWGTSSGLVILPHINPNVSYHPTNSFEPVSWIGTSPYFLAVAADSPYKTAKELMDAAKRNPDTLMFGTQGPGSSPHVTIEALLGEVDAKMVHVPFKGGQDMINGVIRGDVAWGLELSNGVLPLAEAGRLRLLAVTNLERLASAPDVPTIEEALGVKGFQSLSWIGVFAPKGTAPERIAKLNQLIANALQDPDVIRVLKAGGFTAASSTPQELGETVKREYDNWGAVVRKYNLQLK